MKLHKVELIAPSPPFGVTLSPARERKLHLLQGQKEHHIKRTFKKAFRRLRKFWGNIKNTALTFLK